ncbi:hypothetical protein B0H63DRAFT_561415 [Podospora didyma]|uniref:Ent-kaurene synthase n=1 Tax=Podospora didyma TaxID=330526 RepID=A0AAE0NHZ5_9PEZI|nr:hypothetical protein B0H63DRAFT_561415 [Podospora didyma]
MVDEFKEPLYSHPKAESSVMAAPVKQSTVENPIDIFVIANAAGKNPEDTDAKMETARRDDIPDTTDAEVRNGQNSDTLATAADDSNLFQIHIDESLALIKELGQKVNILEPFGSFSTSLYDTAWLARVRTPDGDWLFPQCFQHLIHTQEPEGGWPIYGADTDGIMSTMASLIALRDHYRHNPENASIPVPRPLIGERILLAEANLRHRLQVWDVALAVHVGFEILVPSLLDELELDDSIKKFEFTGRPLLMSMNQRKLRKFRPEMIYDPVTTTLVHSLEGLVGKIDFDRVSHHLTHGSMLASPAATAAYLIYSTDWDPAAESYLRSVVANGSGKGGGSVPTAFPSAFFELAWVTSTLLKTRASTEILALPDAVKISAFLEYQLERHGGAVGFDEGLLEDSDDTAKVILVLRLLGIRVFPKRLIAEFEDKDNFRTYKYEMSVSLSVNCNVLAALVHCQDPETYHSQIVKISRSLCRDLLSGNVRDKWNLTNGYSFMLLSQAFVKLIQIWDSGLIGQLPEDLIREQIPIALLHTLLQILHTQTSAGYWAFKNHESLEATSYAVLALNALSTLPWVLYIRPQVLAAIRNGAAYLAQHRDEWRQDEHLWVAKVSYALPTVARAYIIAAVGADSNTSHAWGTKATTIVTVPNNALRSKALHYSKKLACFAGDEPLDKDGIIFAWIAMNRRHNYPLPNTALRDMMKLFVLMLDLDERMKNVFSELGSPERLEFIRELRSALPKIISFDDGEPQPAPNGDNGKARNGTDVDNEGINGDQENGHQDNDKLAAVMADLRRYASHILDHPAVVRSSADIRIQLHNQMLNCLFSGLGLEETYTRLATPEQDTLANGATDLPCDVASPGVQSTVGSKSQMPVALIFLTCIAASPADEDFFRGLRGRFLLSVISGHLTTMCQHFNNWATVAPDPAEGSLDSFNIFGYHLLFGWDGVQRHPKGKTAISPLKKDLFLLLEYERGCLNQALDKLEAEMKGKQKETWKMGAIKAFLEMVDVYRHL